LRFTEGEVEFEQVESFIPLWEWDLPKKRSKKRKGEKGKSAVEKLRTNGGAYIEEVDDSGDSRPQSRTTRIEEVPDEDSP